MSISFCKSARAFNLINRSMPTGVLNAITDVAGLSVGHVTLRDGDRQTGVTAILPHQGNLFRQKVPAAAHVINGFGKSAGLMQVNELGCLETPIVLTNTLAVGTAFNALVRHAVAGNPDIGRETSTVNPLVFECNDGFLNDIQAMCIREGDIDAAVANANNSTGVFEQGAVGAGTGMSCFGFKGGIGSASRVIELDGKSYQFGTLVLSNFGRPGDLTLPHGRRAVPPKVRDVPEKGSVIIIMATDIPLDHRRLDRVAKRGGAGLARMGAYWGNGSGDIALAMTTGWTISHDEDRDIIPVMMLNENRIDRLFRAAAETTVEAVLNSMTFAPATTGFRGNWRPGLADWLHGSDT